jgi:hypothetical protein
MGTLFGDTSTDDLAGAVNDRNRASKVQTETDAFGRPRVPRRGATETV